MAEQHPPRVFISYSYDSAEHQARVLGLANQLRADGIDAEIDQYNDSPREGWPLWCERQIEAADAVLMVCTETYHRRVSGNEEQGKVWGDVWEARMIRQLLYDGGGVSDKFVPVLFSDASPEQIPKPTRDRARYVVETEDGYEELYRRLTGQPRLRVAGVKLGGLLPRHRRLESSRAMRQRIRPLSLGGAAGGSSRVPVAAARAFCPTTCRSRQQTEQAGPPSTEL